MITKEEFIELITKHKEWNNKIDEISEILDIPTIFESKWVTYTDELFNKTLKLLFNEGEIDDIYWWMYERSENPDLKMWDESGKEIPMNTVEDLWNLIQSYKND